jgi:hypothetical protein
MSGHPTGFRLMYVTGRKGSGPAEGAHGARRVPHRRCLLPAWHRRVWEHDAPRMRILEPAPDVEAAWNDHAA